MKLSGNPHGDRHPQPVHRAIPRLLGKSSVGKNDVVRLSGQRFGGTNAKGRPKGEAAPTFDGQPLAS